MAEVKKRVVGAAKALIGIRPKELSPEQILRLQGKTEMFSSAVRNIDAETQASGGVDFVFSTTVDEHILGYFDPTYPQYNEKFKCLAPLFQRTPLLSNYTEYQSRTYRRMADVLFTEVKNNDLNPDEFRIVRALRVYFYMKINDGVMGYKMDKLTTQKKIISMGGFEEKKK
jgi:hypothetical protein